MIYTEQHRELMRTVTRFIEAEIDPHAEEWDKAGIFPARELFKKMGKEHLLGINKPEKFGGLGLDYSYEVAFCEALGAVKITSSGLEGTCDRLAIAWQEDRVVLDGKAQLKCQREGQDIELRAEQLSLRLSATEGVTSKSPAILEKSKEYELID